MKTQAEIHGIDAYLKDLYSGVRTQQEIDDTYYKDTFTVPWIKKELVRRLGRGARMVDAPAEHIITSQPQFYREESKLTRQDALKNVVSLGNEWIQIMKRQNPNPFKEHVRTNNLRGEVWIQLVHNDKWFKGEKKGMPVRFLLPDPMVVFASPNEDENGMPEYVVLKYKRLPWVLAQLYPKWSKANDVKNLKGEVNFLAYLDAKQDYVEIDKEVVKNQKNIYGFTPFFHSLSGYGKNSPTGDMTDLIVGRLRNVRHNLERKTSLVSDIDSCIHQFANRSVDANITDKSLSVEKVGKDMEQGYQMGDGLIHVNPYGVDVKRAVEALPEQSIFQYLHEVDSELALDDPLQTLSAMAQGDSGRLQDILHSSTMMRYQTLVESAEVSWSTAFSKALELCDKIPGLYPPSLKEKDIDGDFNCRIELKAEDPLSAERLALRGSREYAQKEIDLRTNLVERKGYTQDKADNIINQMIIDDATINNPMFRQIVGNTALKQMGMEAEMAEAQVGGAQDLTGLNPTEMQRAVGQVESPEGAEMANIQRQQRKSPEAYTRGGM